MSTRANVIIRQGNDNIVFYRHSDGYPEVTGKDLKEFVKGYASKFRNNVTQSAGWLIIHGRENWIKQQEILTKRYGSLGTAYAWKCGDYEITTELHGDIDYVYTIDLDKGILETQNVNTGRTIEQHVFTVWKGF
jgi:hypothetical protein